MEEKKILDNSEDQLLKKRGRGRPPNPKTTSDNLKNKGNKKTVCKIDKNSSRPKPITQSINKFVVTLCISDKEVQNIISEIQPDPAHTTEICSIFKYTPETEEDILKEIPTVYNHIEIPVLPQNIPVKLFNDEINEKNTFVSNYSNIILPIFHKNDGKWPTSSPYACWNCELFFDTPPIGIPDKEKNRYYYCYGNFCCFSCAARYLVDHEPANCYFEKYSLLCSIYRRVFKLPADSKIPIADPKETLEKYGGKSTYDQYHKNHLVKQKIEIFRLPLIPTEVHMERILRTLQPDSINIKKEGKKYIPIDPEKYQKAHANFSKYKRSKEK